MTGKRKRLLAEFLRLAQNSEAFKGTLAKIEYKLYLLMRGEKSYHLVDFGIFKPVYFSKASLVAEGKQF